MYIFDNLIVNCFFQGAPKEEILRCSVADDNTFSDNVFLNKQLTNEAEKDFEAVKVYAVELEHLSMFDKAKHCASIFSYKKVWQWPMTNNITLAFINIDPPDPVNIMLEPKQETTDFMLAETYKLLILRIMTTKVKSMENIYPPVHVKGYQPGFQGKNTGCLKKGEFYKTFTIIEVCPNKITNKMKQGLTMETRVKALMMTWGSSYDDMMILIWFQDDDRRLLKWYVFRKYVVVMVTNWKKWR